MTIILYAHQKTASADVSGLRIDHGECTLGGHGGIVGADVTEDLGGIVRRLIRAQSASIFARITPAVEFLRRRHPAGG